MAWQNPKTDWINNPKNPKSEDFNRIEGNIDFLKQDIENKKGEIVDAINTMGQSAISTDTHSALANKIKDISKDADAAVTDVYPGKTFYQGGVIRTGAMPTKAAETITPGTANKTIAAGQYLTGVQTILGDPDLASPNIKGGINIFGIDGKASVVETADATIVAGDVLSGKTGYKNGAKITGSISSKAAETITPGTTNKTIAANQYLSGVQTIAGDSNLVTGNIVKGKSIFGVAGDADIAEYRIDGPPVYNLPSSIYASTGVTTPTRMLAWTMGLGGTIRLSGYISGSHSGTYRPCSFRVLKNGVAVRSDYTTDNYGNGILVTLDIVVSKGDVVEIQGWTTGPGMTPLIGKDFKVLGKPVIADLIKL